MSVFILGVFLLGITLISNNAPQESVSSSPKTPLPTRKPPTPTKWVAPTSTPNPWPILGGLRSYPWVNELDLVKRPGYYKNKPICLDKITIFNVREDQSGTTFRIQSSTGNYTVVGTAYYAGAMPDLFDNYSIIIGGYVVGTESDLNISSLSLPVVVVQKFHWVSSDYQFQNYTIGDGDVSQCKYLEQNTLLGHWLSEDGRTHYYIDGERSP